MPRQATPSVVHPLPGFAATIITWQRLQGRHHLPWQNTRDPYRIWLSEIMLQQTQVATVIPYFTRFLARFPDVRTLAAAPQEQVLEHWAGLGYYARGRNLHRCAQEVVAQHGGRFPDDAGILATLPGIGRSTAAAIAAFAFGERAAILDGNVRRVLTRTHGIEGYPGASAITRQLWTLAETLLPDAEIGTYTQGLMDLGATVCTRQPHCSECPLATVCVAKSTGRQHELPTPRPARAVPLRRATISLLCDGQRVLLQQRPPQGIWGGLLSAPEGEAAEVAARCGLTLAAHGRLPELTHRFTHFTLTLEPCVARVQAGLTARGDDTLRWIDLATADAAAIPTPLRRLLPQLRAWLLASDAGAAPLAQ